MGLIDRAKQRLAAERDAFQASEPPPPRRRSARAASNGRTCDQRGCTNECTGHNTTCDAHIAAL